MKNDDEFLFLNQRDRNKLAFNFLDFQQISSIDEQKRECHEAINEDTFLFILNDRLMKKAGKSWQLL